MTETAAYDQVFVYGVVTTGVFCLPSCAARPARPENLRFFLDVDSALAADLRECKRCRPCAAPALRETLVAVARHIADNAEQTLTLTALAARTDMSPTVLQKKFTALFGVSPKAFHSGLRSEAFKAALSDGATVTEAIYAAGFGSGSRVYDAGSQSIGMSPSSYRDGGKGEHISYCAGKTSFGWLMLAATDSGVCFVQFGASKPELLRQLHTEFPNAVLAASGANGSQQLTAWFAALKQHLDEDGPRPDVPIDLRGTAFQIKVWKFLLKIPAGKTASYSDVARGIGKNSAVRAAASACGANRIAVLIPCHRVLRGDGSLGGYRWGTERKQQLLQQLL